MSTRTHDPRRGGGPRPFDLAAFADQVARAAGDTDTGRREPTTEDLVDRRGYPRPVQCQPGYAIAHEPGNKGHTYPPNALTVEECFELLRACDQGTLYGRRLFFAVLFTWQGAFRVSEACAVVREDVDLERGRVVVRRGKGGKRRTVALAQWTWPLLQPWLTERADMPDGPLICVVAGPNRGRRAWLVNDFRTQLHLLAQKAGIERRGEAKGEFAGKRCAPHQLRHSWAVQAYNGGVPLRTIQLHLGHSNIGITDTYLRGAGADETLDQVYEQAAPMVPATAMLALSGLDRGLVPA